MLSRLHRSALPSATRLVELLDSDDERIALAAARAILDRAGYGAVKGEYNMKTTVFVQGGQLSMDQGKLKGTNDCGESTEWADPAVDGSERRKLTVDECLTLDINALVWTEAPTVQRTGELELTARIVLRHV